MPACSPSGDGGDGRSVRPRPQSRVASSHPWPTGCCSKQEDLYDRTRTAFLTRAGVLTELAIRGYVVDADGQVQVRRQPVAGAHAAPRRGARRLRAPARSLVVARRMGFPPRVGRSRRCADQLVCCRLHRRAGRARAFGGEVHGQCRAAPPRALPPARRGRTSSHGRGSALPAALLRVVHEVTCGLSGAPGGGRSDVDELGAGAPGGELAIGRGRCE
jgi:hypothetical protein